MAHGFIHSINKYLSAYNVPGTVISTLGYNNKENRFLLIDNTWGEEVSPAWVNEQ